MVDDADVGGSDDGEFAILLRASAWCGDPAETLRNFPVGIFLASADLERYAFATVNRLPFNPADHYENAALLPQPGLLDSRSGR
jgi:hypothetical protein